MPDCQAQLCYLPANWKMAKLINFFVLQFLHLWYGIYTSIFFMCLNKLLLVKFLKQHLEYRKHYVSVSYINKVTD